MKWFLFFLALFLSNCKYQQKEKQVQSSSDSVSPVSPSVLLNEKPKTYTDSFEADYHLTDDTGYFKNLAIPSVEELGYSINNLLDTFLNNLISKKDIILLNKAGLLHSCRITDKGNIRFDTLRNGKISFIQKQNLGLYSDYDNSSSLLKINGKTVKAKSVTSTEDEYLFDFDPSSFRDFLFHGREFYYMRAMQTGSQGQSMGNVSFHLIYDVSLNKLFYVESCRLDYWVPFGDINNDGNLDLIDFNNSDFCTTVPSSDRVIIQFYSYKNGAFILQKGKTGIPYSIEGNTGMNYSQDSFNISESYWPVKIK